jgi:hypothetical protein
LLGASSKISQYHSIQAIDGREVDGFGPKELHHLQLRDDANNMARLVGHQELMDAAAQNLNRLREVAVGLQIDKSLLSADLLDISERYTLTLLSLVDDAVEELNLSFFGLRKANDDE